MNENVINIYNFLVENDCDLNNINNRIHEIELDMKQKIKDVESFANQNGISISVNDSQNISNTIGKLTGVWYLQYAYKYDQKIVTAMCDGWHILFYAIRDSISDYYTLVNAEVKNDTIKTHGKLAIYNDDEEKYLIKTYQNGNRVYKFTDEIEQRYNLVIEIAKIVDSHMKQ